VIIFVSIFFTSVLCQYNNNSFCPKELVFFKFNCFFLPPSAAGELKTFRSEKGETAVLDFPWSTIALKKAGLLTLAFSCIFPLSLVQLKKFLTKFFKKGVFILLKFLIKPYLPLAFLFTEVKEDFFFITARRQFIFHLFIYSYFFPC